MIILKIILLILNLFFLFFVLNIYINVLVINSKRIWIRKLISFRAKRVLDVMITKQMGELSYPLILQLYFNRTKYRKYYVVKGFEQTLNFIRNNYISSIEQKKKEEEYFLKKYPNSDLSLEEHKELDSILNSN